LIAVLFMVTCVPAFCIRLPRQPIGWRLQVNLAPQGAIELEAAWMLASSAIDLGRGTLPAAMPGRCCGAMSLPFTRQSCYFQIATHAQPAPTPTGPSPAIVERRLFPAASATSEAIFTDERKFGPIGYYR
jgi:hypothetical protein